VIDAFTDAAIESCDELDGVKDGVIANPSKCQFNASSIVGQTVQCTQPSSSISLTDEHAQLINAVWEGPRSVEGSFEWYGQAKDASLTALLSTECESMNNCTTAPFSISTDYISIFLARNASFNVNAITRGSYDRLFRESVDQYTSVIGTNNPDLTDFKSGGRKMIAWHGLADELITPFGTTDYYGRLSKLDQEISDYYRLFLAPGVEHCGGGPGLDPSETIFDSLIAWVENGTAPEMVPAIGPAVGQNGTR
jgi:hypothetical protein